MNMSSLKIRGGDVFLVALPIRRPHHWVGHTARIGEGYVVLRLEPKAASSAGVRRR
jgi:hypothetical protein